MKFGIMDEDSDLFFKLLHHIENVADENNYDRRRFMNAVASMLNENAELLRIEENAQIRREKRRAKKRR